MRLLFLLLLIGVQVAAQDVRVRKGVVMDSLPVEGYPDESYSLFFPNGYNSEAANFPVLFIFDGQGRGKAAAQLFKPAAESQNFIIASSNSIDADINILDNVKRATRLIQAVTSNVPVDLKQISVSGFGMGAKVASVIPLLIEDIHGVIAVGDHQLNLDLLKRRDDFYFVGIGGNETVVKHEMAFIVNELNNRGIPGAFITYQGGAEWPHPEVISFALGLLSTQAMREDLRPKNQSLLQQMYSTDLSRVDRLIRDGEAIAAHEFLINLELKYEDLVDLKEIRDKRARLENSADYKEKRLEYDHLLLSELKTNSDYISYFEQDIVTLNFENVGWWNYQVFLLDQKIAGNNPQESAMAHRLKQNLRQMPKVAMANLKDMDPSTEERLLLNMLSTVFDQQDYPAYLNVIRLSAIDGDYATALFYLEELLKNGYQDVDALYELEGTLGLRLTRDFNGLIKKYTGSSRFFNQSL